MNKGKDRKQAAGKILISLWLLLLSVAACQSNGALPDPVTPAAATVDQQQIATEQKPEIEATAEEPQTPVPLMTAGAAAGDLPPLGYTHHRPDGNRLVAGSGTAPRAQPLDITLEGQTDMGDGRAFGRGGLMGCGTGQ